jgi:hypothetical protein
MLVSLYNDGYTRLAISELFTVIDQETPTLPPSQPLVSHLRKNGLVLYLPLDNNSQDIERLGESWGSNLNSNFTRKNWTSI